MQLNYKRIPPEFIENLPDGFAFLKKHGRTFLVVDRVTCPKGHSLMDSSVRIHGEPSVKMKLEIGKTSGLLFVDAFWGGHQKLYSFIPEQGIVKAYCPVCDASLLVPEPCAEPVCGCQTGILLNLPGDNNNGIRICAKLGCPGHRLVIDNESSDVTRLIDEINNVDPAVVCGPGYFGTQDDDQFQGI